MNEWYYARGGKQSGPVTIEVLADLAKNGGIDPINDLVWTSTMKDWLPAGQVPGIFGTAAKPATRLADPANPYAAPESTWTEQPIAHAGEVLPEIEPGSQPISARSCIKRGFDLVIRNIGMLLLIFIVYVVVSALVGGLLGAMDSALGLNPPDRPVEIQPSGTPGGFKFETSETTSGGSFLNAILSNIFSTFMALGLCRIGLNVVSGKPLEIGQLFGGAKKLVPAVLGSILYALMVGVGFLLLIVPGIYLALRYGQFMFAMVDKDLGVMDSFKYSSSITTNNRMKLFILGILSFLVVLAGLLALVFGLAVAMPVAWISWVVAYRWMQYGFSAALDQPGTKTPMLAGSA